eukprot:GDKH01020515.1.p6 GENE.GDKH01020515.1~~GDKH01020515.1.p6  ORF type:complete len:54 (+),score=4.75 GDKH01020515.1:657-818(+)
MRLRPSRSVAVPEAVRSVDRGMIAPMRGGVVPEFWALPHGENVVRASFIACMI